MYRYFLTLYFFTVCVISSVCEKKHSVQLRSALVRTVWLTNLVFTLSYPEMDIHQPHVQLQETRCLSPSSSRHPRALQKDTCFLADAVPRHLQFPTMNCSLISVGSIPTAVLKINNAVYMVIQFRLCCTIRCHLLSIMVRITPRLS